MVPLTSHCVTACRYPCPSPPSHSPHQAYRQFLQTMASSITQDPQEYGCHSRTMILASCDLSLNGLSFHSCQTTAADLQVQQRAHISIRPLHMPLKSHDLDFLKAAGCFWTEEAMILEFLAPSARNDSLWELLDPFTVVLYDVLVMQSSECFFNAHRERRTYKTRGIADRLWQICATPGKKPSHLL